MIKVFALGSSIPKVCVRRLSVSQTIHQKPDMSAIKRKQMKFQVCEDVPVHLKGGTVDYLMYYASVALVALGVGLSTSSLYKLMNKN